jgi:hypothetical protein
MAVSQKQKKSCQTQYKICSTARDGKSATANFSETHLTGCNAKALPQFVDQQISKCERDESNKPVFTWNMEKVATKQLKKVHHAFDVPGMNMSQEILPGPRLTHSLSK